MFWEQKFEKRCLKWDGKAVQQNWMVIIFRWWNQQWCLFTSLAYYCHYPPHILKDDKFNYFQNSWPLSSLQMPWVLSLACVSFMCHCSTPVTVTQSHWIGLCWTLFSGLCKYKQNIGLLDYDNWNIWWFITRHLIHIILKCLFLNSTIRRYLCGLPAL